MTAFSAPLLALAITVTTLLSGQAFAQQIPNMAGSYTAIPNQCNFQGLGVVTAATVTNETSNNGPVIVLKIIGKTTGEIGFLTSQARTPNASQRDATQAQYFDTDVVISQVAIAITNTIHDEYPDGHKDLEAVLSLILTGSQLEFIANEGTGLQETCKFTRTN